MLGQKQDNKTQIYQPQNNTQIQPIQQQQEPLKMYEGVFVGSMPVSNGIISTGKNAGKPWIRTMFKFRSDNGYDKDFTTFTPLPGKASLQAEQLVSGKRYKVGYAQKDFVKDGEARKSNTVIFINERSEQPQLQTQVVQQETMTQPQPISDDLTTSAAPNTFESEKVLGSNVEPEETALMQRFKNDSSVEKNVPNWIKYYKDESLKRGVYFPEETEERAGKVWEWLVMRNG